MVLALPFKTSNDLPSRGHYMAALPFKTYNVFPSRGHYMEIMLRADLGLHVSIIKKNHNLS